ncbi:MAG: general secretion pathway protein GspK [Luteolibacter sp.]
MRNAHPSHHRGAALMAVLWLIAILAVASITALKVISFDMSVAASTIHGARAKHMAEMGIAIGSHPLIERTDPLLYFEDEQKQEGYQVTLSSEGQRFNINAIIAGRDTDLLNTMFTQWGMELDESEALVDALTDWFDGDDQVSIKGAEAEQYEQAGRLNQPFNRPYYNLDEMRLVVGMDRLEALQPDWRDWFTVWSSGQLDLNDASAEFIAMAAECPIEQALLVIEAVEGRDGIRNSEDDEPFKDVGSALALLGIDPTLDPLLTQRFTINDTTVRIESIGWAGEARRRTTLILRNRNGTKPALLLRTQEILP